MVIEKFIEKKKKRIIEKKIVLNKLIKIFICKGDIDFFTIFWFITIIKVAPIEAIKANNTPRVFKLLKDGPNTKNNPIKVDMKRIFTECDIFSLSIIIEINKTKIGLV